MNRKWIVPLMVILVLGAAAAFWLRSGSSPAAPPASPYLTEAPASEIKDIIKKQNSPVVLVNFWASWCEPCKLEFPMILELQEKYAARGLKVIFVSIDETADFPAAEAFLKSQKTPVMSFVKGAQSLSLVSDLNPTWHGAVPMTLLFGPDMKILDSWEGNADFKEFEHRIQPYLRGT